MSVEEMDCVEVSMEVDKRPPQKSMIRRVVSRVHSMLLGILSCHRYPAKMHWALVPRSQTPGR